MTSGDPFVGPKPFGSENTIFGRDLEIAELRYYLGAKRIVVLHSPSGAGKSSLLWARNGLLNKLRATGQFDVWGPARVNQSPEGLPVANRFAWSVINDFEKSRKPAARPAEDFAQTTLAAYVSERRTSKSPLLVFDQFEEVLRLDATGEARKRAFFQQLGEALEDRSVWALIAIREDYLAGLTPYARMLPTCLQNQFRIDFLRREDQALDAVSGPLRGVGRQFEAGVAEQMLENLARMKVLEWDAYVEYAGDFVEPLQLQLVCVDLWTRIRSRDSAQPIRLEDCGDLTKALGDYYDATVEREDVHAERFIREWFDKRLISPEGVRNLLRREPKETAGLANSVIEALVENSYLVRQEQRSGTVWFELSHDRLTEPVRMSNDLWFEKNLTALHRAAGLWEARGRSGSLVMTGDALSSAKDELKAKGAGLTAIDQAFLKEAEQKQSTLTWGCISSAIGTALLILWIIGQLSKLLTR